LLNAAIGQLLKDHPPERVRPLLRVRGLDDLYCRTLERVIENSHRYYTEQRYREAVDRVLSWMFEEQ
jgi:hypothetical protein